MGKDIMAAASFYKQSYFFNPDYDELPTEVKKEIRALAAVTAEKTRGIVCIGFSGGNMFIESSGLETDGDYDEINARLVVDEVIEEKKDFLKSLSEWYGLFKTAGGQKMKDAFLSKLPFQREE